jgi:hypothetical protein
MRLVQPRSICLLLLMATLALTCGAEDPVFSGPQVGEPLPPFSVVAVYGGDAGKEFDPIKVAEGKATLLVFVHKLTRPGVALTRALTVYAKSQAEHGAVGAIIWLQDDKAAAEEYLVRAKKSLNFAVPVGVSVDGGEGPGAYGLNRNVELTILIAKDNKVAANFALLQPSVTEAAKIAGELAKLIEQPAPDQKQMEKLAFPGGAMMRARPRPAAGNAPAAQPGNELRTLMRQVIAPGIGETELAAAVKAIDAWVGEDQQRQANLARMATAVLDRGMGSEAARATIKKWQQKYAGKKSAAADQEKR